MQSVDMEEIPINDVITKQPVKENGTKEDEHIYESQEQAAPLLQSPNSEQQVSQNIISLTTLKTERRGPYLQSCQWGFNMVKLKLSQISYPVVHCENTYISTLEGQDSISCG